MGRKEEKEGGKKTKGTVKGGRREKKGEWRKKGRGKERGEIYPHFLVQNDANVRE